MKASQLFELPKSLEIFSEFFKADIAPWEWVKNIAPALKSLDFSKLEKPKDIPAGVRIVGDVFIHKSVKLPVFCHIEGPCYIAENVEIRVGAFIRGNVIVGNNSIIGNSCEYKNSLLLENVQTPHYNYVGDSVLGNKAHLGAGVICANLRLDKANVQITTSEKSINTNMRKLGAILADEAEAGCNAVLQPGTILMKKSIVLSSMAFSGVLEENTMAAQKNTIRKIQRRKF